ncbi:cytochrome P450 [Frankia nepalensis]|uniref:cytochrome P450 n=1 Tax=Frankia nepalensis TaxID=1836974 RepID=UPI0027DD8B56|nr:cytochrome P450 [Frankia nepalensis]
MDDVGTVVTAVATPARVEDLLSSETRPDPYRAYADLRAQGAVHPSPMGIAVVTRYQECAEVLSDPRWSHANEAELFHPGVEHTELPASFLWMDPPDHTRLRGLVSKAFTARTVSDLRQRITRIVDGLLDPVIGAGTTDLVEALAYPLPLTVICELLGVPASDHPLVHGWAPALARGFDPDPLLSPRERVARTDAAVELLEYFGGLVSRARDRAARGEPATDLVSELARVHDHGDALTEHEMLATCVTLLIAGHETTVNLVGNGLLGLIRDPDQLDLLRRRPELHGAAVDEMLRHDSPVHMTTRAALTNLTVAGHEFAPGEGVIVLIGSANRDDRAFARPDELDLTRYANRETVAARHLSFSLGMHYCLGAPLARLEMEVLLTALARRGAQLELDAAGPTYKPNLVLRGLATLPGRIN